MDVGVVNLLLEGLWKRLVSCLFSSLLLTRLACGVFFFTGDAKHLPKATWGSLLSSPSGKFLQHTLE